MALYGTDICRIAFITKKEEKAEILLLRQQWQDESVSRNDAKIGKVAKRAFGQSSWTCGMLVQGTDFQMKVWQELLAIPKGEVATYRDIAQKIGSSKAVRAVGTACSMNPIAFLIPCHRVLTSNGGLGGYRWGLERKKALLAWEAR